MPAPSDPRPRPSAKPEIEPPPGSLPKRFPGNPEPLSGQENESSKPDDAPSTRLGSGEDPSVESGVDHDDPEQPAETDVDKSFE
jgi:hypothetical protein